MGVFNQHTPGLALDSSDSPRGVAQQHDVVTVTLDREILVQRSNNGSLRLGDELVFRRELAQEGRLGPLRWLSMFLGVAGTYRRHETVDVVYEEGGRRTVASLTPS